MSGRGLRRTMRLVHYWISLLVLIAGGLVATTGVFLLLKKDVDWLQPPVAAVSVRQGSAARVDDLFAAASRAAPAPLSWADIDRIDVRPSDGVAKVVTSDAAEYQVDLQSLRVVGIGYRGADIIETIHDGSFFGGWVKYGIMLPSGIALFVMWVTGIYLFFLPRIAAVRRARSHRLRHRPRK